MKSTSAQNLSVAYSVAAILAGLALVQAPAVHAAEEGDSLEEVTVTGSRIVRRDYQSNSPLVSVDSAALESQSSLNVESYLNQLPAFNPAGSPAVKGGFGSNSDVQISPVNTVGVASVSLRGFGPNRSLVLIDGRSAVPTNSLMVVDVNGIPSSMIKRVEIISGGASAVYGADAVGGVSNFLLRRDFQGVEMDGQFGTTEAGDGDEMRASLIVGSKFDEGRGNFAFATEYYDRHAAFEKNRDYFTDNWGDPDVPGNFATSILGSNGYYAFTNPPAAATLGAILSNRPAGTGVYTFPGSGQNASLRFNTDGTIFDPAGNNAGSWRGAPIDGYRYSYINAYDTSLCNSSNPVTCPAGATPVQLLKYVETEGYVDAPQTRYSFMASANYDFSDRIHLMTSARFAQSRTLTLLSTTNAAYGVESTVPYNATVDSPVNPALNYRDPTVVAAVLANPAAYANPGFIAHGAAGAQHPVPLQMAMLLNSRTTAPLTSGWIMELFPYFSFPHRTTSNLNSMYQLETGVTFDLPLKDWTAEAYYSRGESHVNGNSQGVYSLARLRALVTAADYGRNSALQSNRTPPNGPGANPGFASLPVPCTSGFYETIFNGDRPASEDCQYAVLAQLQSQAQNQQDIAELNFQGGLFSLPAGEIRSAFGLQYRRNASQFNPDMMQSTASFTDQAVGLYPTGYLDAQVKARDYYAELMVPVLQDFFVRKLELELGGRFSDYDVTDSSTTFKINANVEITNSLRLRGGFNRATRAPNLGEMFLPLQQLYTSTGAYGDPCSVLSNSPFGAGGAIANPVPASGGEARLASGQTAAGAQSAYLICRAQMGTVGANRFYGPTQAQPAATGGALGSLNQVGNPDLDSEKADTWTAGIVLQSPFDHALLRGITATVDWYQISIRDAILPYSADYARYLCYGAVQVGSAAEAAAQAATPACSVMPRDQTTGAYQLNQVSYANQATVATSGVDFTVAWRAQLADMGLGALPGGVSLTVDGTWLDYYRTKQSPASFDPVTDWKGSIGPNLTSFNGGAYSYRLFTSLSYNLPSLSVSLRWRHLPSVDVAAKASEDAIKSNNAKVAAGGAGTLLSYTPITNLAAPAYDVFDLSASWSFTDTLSLRFGVNNVLDKDPLPINTAGVGLLSATSGYPLGTNLNAVCNGAPGCVNPTSYSVAAKSIPASNGGYYDEMGRRYYIGPESEVLIAPGRVNQEPPSRAGAGGFFASLSRYARMSSTSPY